MKRKLILGAVLLCAIYVILSCVLLWTPIAIETRDTSSPYGCVNCLRQIDSAKEQAALRFKLKIGAFPTDEQLRHFLPNESIPSCPLDGVYRINPIGVNPTCSLGEQDLWPKKRKKMRRWLNFYYYPHEETPHAHRIVETD